MGQNINVRLPDSLQKFIKAQTNGKGVYDSTSEYIRDLIRRDYERLEALKWQKLESVLRPALDASENDFKAASRHDVINAAKARRHDA
jgi:antitoxin ParD1/3/4